MPSPTVRHARQERGIASRAEQIFHAKSSFVAGNPNGDVSVVTFLDYNCLYCREGAPDLAKLIAQDGKVRLVRKKLPVLGKDSEEVARVALAAAPQGKYLELDQRLFAEPGHQGEGAPHRRRAWPRYGACWNVIPESRAPSDLNALQFQVV